MKLGIVKMNEYMGNGQRDAAEVFVEGYFDLLSMPCSDKETLIAAYEGGFNENIFYIACVNGKAVGITACANKHSSAILTAPRTSNA